MARVLVIGGGLAGCAAAARLADAGVVVTLVEREAAVGGRVRSYGCKATDKCNNCGVCLTAGLWEKVERHPLIEVLASSRLAELAGTQGDFWAAVQTPDGPRYLSGISDVVVATGFESLSTGISSHLQIEGRGGIMTGTQIEHVLLQRSGTALLQKPPKSVAFIQCFGSRDEKERAMYCSRVCCGYSTRAARVLRQYYPACGITFFYMELQAVANSDVYDELVALGVEFVKCRPRDIKGGHPAAISYDDPARGMQTREFDLVVLSEGIHPAPGAGEVAAACGLGQDEHGFFAPEGMRAGVHVAGCAKTPLKIEETFADGVAVGAAIAAGLAARGGLCV